MSNKKVSQLDSALSIALLDLLLLTQVDGNAETGYSSKKITVSDLANKLNSDIQYATDLPDFTDKTITGALQELKDMLISQIPVKNTFPAPIANFNTDLALPLKSLNVEIKPKQASGTPTPSNPLPISGTDTVIITQTGKNLFSKPAYSSWTSAGSYNKLSNITPNNTELIMSFIDKDPTVDVSGCYFGFVESSYNTGSLTDYRWCLNNGSLQSNKTNKSINSAILCNSLLMYPNNETTYNKITSRWDIQIEVGTTATTYEAYTATTKTVSLPETVYGGEVDVIGGSGESEMGIITYNGSEDWQRTAGGSYYMNNSNMKSGVNMSGISNIFAVGQDITIGTIRLGNAIGNTPNQRIYFVDDGTQFADVTAWKTFLASNNLQICYPLATPTPITLANPIELTAKAGVNNVFGDTNGNTTVEFRESIQKYIDDQIAATQALIL